MLLGAKGGAESREQEASVPAPATQIVGGMCFAKNVLSGSTVHFAGSCYILSIWVK